MGDHFSNFAIDRLMMTAGGRVARPDHFETCSECRARWEKMAAAHHEASSSPGFEATFMRAVATHDTEISNSRPLRRWRFSFVLAPLAALIALMIIVLPTDPEPGRRLKGSFSIKIIRENGTNATELHPGEHVAIAVASTGASYVLVFAVADSGDMEQVWPTNVAESGLIPKTPSKVLQPGFAVTPGSFTLHAFFSDEPISSSAVRKLSDARLDPRTISTATGALPIPSMPGELGRAVLRVRVTDGS